MLDVASWPSNTRLSKALAGKGLVVECKFPSPARLPKWLIAWTKQQYRARLEADAAEALVEVVEAGAGAVRFRAVEAGAVGRRRRVIRAELVRESVGGWRTRTTWEMLDLAAGGNARQALVELDHLLSAGEVPISILAQIGSTLRRFAAAARLIEQAEAAGRRLSLRQALEEAGFKAFTLSKAESQLRQIGRVRAGAAVSLAAGRRLGAEGFEFFAGAGPAGSGAAVWSGFRPPPPPPARRPLCRGERPNAREPRQGAELAAR